MQQTDLDTTIERNNKLLKFIKIFSIVVSASLFGSALIGAIFLTGMMQIMVPVLTICGILLNTRISVELSYGLKSYNETLQRQKEYNVKSFEHEKFSTKTQQDTKVVTNNNSYNLQKEDEKTM